MKDKKNILIAGLLVAIVLLSVGYASLGQRLDINGSATIKNWKVEITGITKETPVGDAYELAAPTFTTSTATFNVGLVNAGDSVVYDVTVENKGDIDAKLDSLSLVTTEDGTTPIKYSIVNTSPAVNSVLAAGGTATFKVKVEYDSTFSGTITELNKTKTNTCRIEYVQNN